MVDLFMKRLYDVDVYLTDSKYGDEQYSIKILFFPSKFFKGSIEELSAKLEGVEDEGYRGDIK